MSGAKQEKPNYHLFGGEPLPLAPHDLREVLKRPHYSLLQEAFEDLSRANGFDLFHLRREYGAILTAYWNSKRSAYNRACEQGLVDLGMELVYDDERLSIDSAEVNGTDRMGSFTREAIVLPFSNRALTINRINAEEKDTVYTASDGSHLDDQLMSPPTIKTEMRYRLEEFRGLSYVVVLRNGAIASLEREERAYINPEDPFSQDKRTKTILEFPKVRFSDI